MPESKPFPVLHLRPLVCALAAALLTGCASLLPPEPETDLPVLTQNDAWKHAPAATGWASAERAEHWQAGRWWLALDEPGLDALMQQLEADNPGLALAAANVAQAQAVLREQQAQRWPSLGAQLGQQRSGGDDRAASGSASLNLSASWQPDLWGRVADGLQAQQASVQASQADLAGVRLAAQAALAQAWLGWRASAAEIGLLQDILSGYERAATITRNRYEAGVSARTDVEQAETTLSNTRASLVALQRSRSAYEHAMAVLLGQPPAAFSPPDAPWSDRLAEVPAELPSLLLLRRPDVASAERALSAANLRLGVARRAHFPDLSLSASVGAGAAHMGDLLSAPGLLWSLGLNLAHTLFDAGARDARTAQTVASRDAAEARYRQTALNALKEVEDQLSALHTLAEQAGHAQASVQAAERVERQMLNRYESGLSAYTEVVTAQASALSARRNLLALQLQHQQASVALVEALGGGWQSPWQHERPNP